MLDLFRQLHEQGTTIIVVTHDALVASCAQREIMLNHGVLVGEKWNDEAAKKAYEQAGASRHTPVPLRKARRMARRPSVSPTRPKPRKPVVRNKLKSAEIALKLR